MCHLDYVLVQNISYFLLTDSEMIVVCQFGASV